MVEKTQKLPILVLGLMPRTGTNFLARLLTSHVDCTKAKTLREDFLVRGLPHLQSYIQTVSDCWQPYWPCHGRLDSLREHFGNALVRFLQEDAEAPDKRPIFKSPSVIGVDLLDRFLPQLDVVIILRQGPATIESGMRSFGWDFETASRRWGNAVKTVLEVSERRQSEGRPPLALVRYEDLTTKTESEFRKILVQVGLDPAGFDFESLAEVPVIGSSQQEDIRWKPVTKSKTFDPLARAAHWSPRAFVRFDRLSDGGSAKLGYQLPRTYSGTALSAAWEHMNDAKQWLPWRLQNLLRFKP